MLKIRLQRIGKKGQAYFRLVVLEHTTKPKGRYLELLGSYDPHKNTLEAKADRVKHWISQGAQLSATANNLLVGRKIIEGEKVQVWKAKKSDKAPEINDQVKPETPKPATPAPEAPQEITEPPAEPAPEPEPSQEEKPAEETKSEPAV